MSNYHDSFSQLLREIAEELESELVQDHPRSAIFKNAIDKIDEIHKRIHFSGVLLPGGIPASAITKSYDKKDNKDVFVQYLTEEENMFE